MAPCAVRFGGVVGNIDSSSGDAHGCRLCKAEVEQCRARLCEHDVAGLDIAMDDALPMGLIEGIGDFDGVLNGLFDRKGSFLQAHFERLAFEVLHDEKGHAILLADVVEGADVRMLERGNRPRLALEPFLELWMPGAILGKDFDRDDAIEPRVARAIHLAHAARADAGNDFVSAETNAGRQRHVCMRRRDYTLLTGGNTDDPGRYCSYVRCFPFEGTSVTAWPAFYDPGKATCRSEVIRETIGAHRSCTDAGADVRPNASSLDRRTRFLSMLFACTRAPLRWR